jgi:lysozyme
LEALRTGDYADAADEMLDSAWARQTPARAQRLAQQMRTGQVAA